MARPTRDEVAGAATYSALLIPTRSPWENGVVESFFAKLASELFFRVEFTCLADAQAAAARWRREYNEYRPMPVLGYRTPAEAASAWWPLSFDVDTE